MENCHRKQKIIWSIIKIILQTIYVLRLKYQRMEVFERKRFDRRQWSRSQEVSNVLHWGSDEMRVVKYFGSAVIGYTLRTPAPDIPTSLTSAVEMHKMLKKNGASLPRIQNMAQILKSCFLEWVLF